jgi:hypothetical protein
MSLKPRGPALLFAGLFLAAGRAPAQEPDTHPAELVRTWAHRQTDGSGRETWSLIRFDPGGRYHAVRLASGDSTGRAAEPVTGLWAVVRTQVSGSLLCTRVDGANDSRCNPFSLDPDGRRLLWKDVEFTLADSTLARRLQPDGF